MHQFADGLALNRRASRSINGVERYAYDRLNRITTLDANGNVIERETFGARLDEPLGISGTTGQRYLHANHLGSVVAVTGSDGLLGRYEYEPYGRSMGSTCRPLQTRFATQQGSMKARISTTTG